MVLNLSTSAWVVRAFRSAVYAAIRYTAKHPTPATEIAVVLARKIAKGNPTQLRKNSKLVFGPGDASCGVQSTI